MNTLARERDKHELLRRLKSVRPDSERRWGRMSAPQMICHLADAFRMQTGERRVAPDGSVLDRMVLKALALHLPMRWPPGILTSLELDQDRGGTKPDDFAEDVARVEALVHTVTAPDRPRDPPPHSRFGPMSDAEWLRWGWLHMDHHLRQFGA